MQVTQPAQLAQGTYRDVVMHRSREGRVLFIGDASHAMSPQLGQGAMLEITTYCRLRHIDSLYRRVEQCRALVQLSGGDETGA